MENVLELCDLVRETSYAIHCYLRNGHPEKVYENALANRLRKVCVEVKQQFPIRVFDEDGTKLGHYTADLLIEEILLVELKSCITIAPEHQAQLFGYLRGSRLHHGMLINFGAPKLQVKKLIL